MSEVTLEAFIRDYIGSQDREEVTFAWQGGEPTLRGLDFFRRAVELQQRYAGGRKITNALQTNGTLIDNEWSEFLAANEFLVGISIDGPPGLHDAYRVDASSEATLSRVLKGLEQLKAHAVEFNTLTVVNALNVKHPLAVYRYLKEIGSSYIQFIPLVERRSKGRASATLAGPPVRGRYGAAELTRWSVGSVAYGRFLTTIFAEWVRHDVGTTHVQIFDGAFRTWMGEGSTLCVFAETCGRQPAIEHDGTVYACDHYVYPEYRLGNLLDRSLAELVDSPAQRAFGTAKRDTLPAHCKRCDLLPACHGGCPRHRFLLTPDGEPGLNYLCAAYREFFRFVRPSMRTMAALLREGKEPAQIMALLARLKSD